jgi:hypothetical protein
VVVVEALALLLEKMVVRVVVEALQIVLGKLAAQVMLARILP